MAACTSASSTIAGQGRRRRHPYRRLPFPLGAERGSAAGRVAYGYPFQPVMELAGIPHPFPLRLGALQGGAAVIAFPPPGAAGFARPPGLAVIGLSPRGRGKPLNTDTDGKARRSIPAWAEEAPGSLKWGGKLQAYPRVGGGSLNTLSCGTAA